MKKILVCVLAAGMLAFTSQPAFSQESTKAEVKQEKAMHPRIAKAIKELKDAVNYLQSAPHDFGGHRADAIAACDEAIKQLKMALEYRAKKDDK